MTDTQEEYTNRECCVTAVTEVGTMQMQAKEYRISGKKEGRSLLKGLLKEHVAPTPSFQGLSSRTPRE